MAIATQVTISTGNKVTFNYQSREVGVSLTYQLEREDTDVLEVVREKATEVARAHQVVWQKMRDEKTAHKRSTRSNSNGNGHKTIKRSAAVDNAAAEAPVASERVADEPASEAQRTAIIALFNASTLTDDEFEALIHERFGWSTVDELSQQQASNLLVELQRTERERLARLRSERNGH